MPSTYTLNNGIELIATGEQSGTWGDTTNVNLGLIDTALDGQVTITLASAGSSGSPNTLPISDGSASNGRNRLVIFADGGDLGATAFVQLTPNDAEKIVYIRNDLSGGRAITLFQGTYNASNDYEVPAGTTAVVFFNGGGSGAVAANVFNNAFFDSLRLGGVSVTAILDEDNMASDSDTALATQQSIKAYVDAQVGANNELSEVLANGNTSGGTNIQMTTTDEVQFRDTALKISSSVDGQLDIDADVELEVTAPTVDINASTAVTIDTATLTMTGSVNVVGDLDVDNLNLNGNSIISTDTNGNITLDPNGTGVVAVTGPATISGNLAVDTSTLFVDAANNRVGVGTSSPAQTQAAHLNLTAAGSGDISAIALNLTNDSTAAGTGVSLRFSPGNVATTARGSYINSVISGANGSDLQFWTTPDGFSPAERTRIDSAGTLIHKLAATFNEDGADADFRVESDTNTHALFVDASTSNVGVGTSTPGVKLTVAGAGITSFLIDGRGSSAEHYTAMYNDTGGIFFGQDAGALSLWLGADNTGSGSAKAVIFSLGSTVFNENGGDTDFRVESVGNTHALFVDAGNNRVGVGTGNPVYTFVVSNGGAEGLEISAGGISANRQNIISFNRSTSAYNSLWIDASDIVLLPPGGGGGSVNIGTSADWGGVLNVNGRVAFRNPDDLGVYGIVPTGFGYSPGAYGVLQLGQSGNSGGTVSIGYDPSSNANGSFTGNGSEMLFANGIDLVTPNAADNAFLYQITMGDSGVVINENSFDLDFRVESDSNANMLVVDAGNNQIHIGKGAGNFATAGGTFYQEGELNLTTNDNRTPLFLNRQQSDGGIINFYRTTASFVGSISVTASATAYNTSSDYRLKEDVQPMVGASDRLMALKPVNFAWKVNGSRVDGFLAHEAQGVVPEAVTGEKDGAEMQAIDHSKLVPLLTAALQEALTEIADLKARLNALEGQ